MPTTVSDNQVSNEAKHTPGPWRVQQREVPESKYGDLFVESEYGGIARVLGGLCPDDETMPNACLIACAPELLAALNGMVGLVQLIQFREPELQGNHRFVEALAVLAKAEGRDA